MKYMMVLMLAVSLLLCGCDWVSDDGYYFVTPHTQQTLPAEDMEVNASTYSELYQALTNMVREGVENRIVYVADYNFSLLEEDAARVVDEVLKTDPVAAYAVEEMKLEQGTNGGREALAVKIRYRHDRSQIKRIRTVQTMAEAQTMIAAELDQCSTGIVLLVKEYAQADLAQVVEDYAAYSPQTVMEIPQTTVNIYPEEGVERIVELKFSYQNSRDALRGMQIQVSPVFTSAVLYVSGDGTEYEKFTQLYSFLMERYDYQLETSITPAYSLLRHGVGDYKAFANVLCGGMPGGGPGLCDSQRYPGRRTVDMESDLRGWGVLPCGPAAQQRCRTLPVLQCRSDGGLCVGLFGFPGYSGAAPGVG